MRTISGDTAHEAQEPCVWGLQSHASRLVLIKEVLRTLKLLEGAAGAAAVEGVGVGAVVDSQAGMPHTALGQSARTPLRSSAALLGLYFLQDSDHAHG